MSPRPVEALPRLSVTVAEASAMTGISKDVLRKHINTGTLAAARPSASWVIDLDDLKAWLNSMKSTGRGEEPNDLVGASTSPGSERSPRYQAEGLALSL